MADPDSPAHAGGTDLLIQPRKASARLVNKEGSFEIRTPQSQTDSPRRSRFRLGFTLTDRTHDGVVFDVGVLGVDAEAGGEVVGFDLGKCGDDLLAIVDRERATRVERAAGWWVDR